ncbi:MAG: 50S ribosomal protein L9 [Candidatus Eisenbacteria bacterium]
MKLILTEDVKRLGSRGDLVTVKDGYGRNFLIPTGKAMPATPGNLVKLEDRAKSEEAKLKRDKSAAMEFAQRLAGVSCSVRVQADESDKLYGAVHEKDISAALEEQGLQVDPQAVILEEPIKTLGVFPVKVHLFREVDAEIKVWVIRE